MNLICTYTQRQIRLGLKLGLGLVLGLKSGTCGSLLVLFYLLQVVDPTNELMEGQIYDSNRSTLLAALKEQGIPTYDLGIARDRSVENLSVVTV